jgi:hypothetical protein
MILVTLLKGGKESDIYRNAKWRANNKLPEGGRAKQGMRSMVQTALNHQP